MADRKYSSLEVDLDFKASTREAQKKINILQGQLTNLMVSANKEISLGNVTKEIEEASQAAASLKAHIDGAVNVKTGKLDLGLLNKSFKEANVSLSDYRKKLSALGQDGQKAFSNLAQSILQADVPLKQTSALMEKFSIAFKNTMRWQVSSTMLHSFLGSIQSAFYYAKDLNESLNNIRIVTGQNTDQMAAFAKQANEAAQALSTTTTKYTDASLIYYQQGLSDEEVKKRTDVTIKMANVTKQSAEEVSSQMTAVWNNFNREGDQAEEHFADVMTKLGAETASSSKEIAEGLSKFSGIANTVGLSFDYAASALATITATTRESADVVGTSLKTIFARLEGLKLGETLEDGTELNQYSAALAKIGVNIKDASGELKNMDTILDETGEKWQNLTQDQKMATAQTVAGVRQYQQFITLMDNWNKMEENLERSRSSTGTLQKQADVYAESWDAAKKRVTAAAEEIYSKLVDEKFFIEADNTLADFLGLISNTIDALGGLKGVLTSLGMVLINVFKEDLAKSIDRFVYNLQDKTKIAQQMRQEAVSNLGQLYQSQGYSDNLSTIIAKPQQAFVENAERLSDIEKQTVQALLEQNAARVGILNNMEKEVQLAQDNFREEKNKITGFLKGEGATDKEIEKIQKLMTYYEKAKQENEHLGNTLAESFNIFGEESTLTAIKQIAEEFQKLDETTIILDNDAKKAFETLKSGSASPKETAAALEKLNSLMTNTKGVATYAFDELVKKIESFGYDTKDATQIVEKLTSSIDKNVAVQGKFQTAIDGARQSSEDLSHTIENLATKNMTLGQSIMGVVRGLGSIAMAINTIKGFGSIWSNSDLSITEKMLSTITSLSFTLPMVASGVKDLIGGIKAMKTALTAFRTVEVVVREATTAGFALVGEELVAVGATEAVTTTQTLGLGAAFKAATADVTIFGMALSTAIPVITAIVGGIAVLGVTISALSDLYNADAIAAENAAKRAEKLGEEYEELKNSYDGLITSLEDYHSARDALDKLTEGTTEWKDAVFELNNQVLELLDKYPELAKYIHNVNGELILDKAGEDSFKENQQKELNKKLSEKLAANAYSKQASTESLSTNLARSSGYTNADGNLVGIDSEDVQAVADALRDNENALELNTEEGAKNLADAAGITEDTAQAILKNPDFKNFADSVQTNADAIDAYTEQLKENILENNEKLKNLPYGEQIAEYKAKQEEKVAKTKSGTDALVNKFPEWMQDISGIGMSVNEIANAYNNEAVNDSIKSVKAFSTAISSATKNLEDKDLGNAIGKALNKQTSADNYTKKDIEFLEKTNFNKLGLTDDQKEKLDIDEKKWNDTIKTVRDNFDRAISTLLNGLPDDIKNAYESINTDDLSVEAMKSVKNILTASFARSSEEGLAETTNVLKNLTSDQLEDLSETFKAAVESDFGTAQNLITDKFEELGISIPEDQLNSFIESLRRLDENLLDTQQDIAQLDIAKKVAGGTDTISEDDYNSLTEAGQRYFMKMLDGTYKLVGSAEKFKEESQEALIAKTKANIESLESKNKGLQSLQGYDFDVLSQTQNLQNSSNAKVIQQQINLIQQLGDASDETRLKIRKWQEASSNNTLNAKDLEDISNEVKKLTESYPSLEDAIESTNAEIQQQRIAIAMTATSMRELDGLLKEGSINQEAYDYALLQLHNNERMEDLDTEEIKNYSNYLQDLAENVENAKIGSDKLAESLKDDADTAKDITIQIARMNGAVDTLADNWKEWSQILRTSSVGSEEYYQAQLGVKKALADLFDVSEDYISLNLVDEFAKDEEAMKLMEKAAKGDGDAIDQLREKASEDIIARIKLEDNVDTSAFESIWGEIQNIMNEHEDDFNVAIGADIKNESFINALQQMVDEAHLSVDQINTVLSSMGYQAEFEAQDQTMQTKVPVITKRHTVVPGPSVQMESHDDKGFATVTEIPTWDETEEVVNVSESTQDVTVPAWALGTVVPGKPANKPQIKAVHKKASGSANNYSKSNPGGKAPGKSGSKKGKGGGKNKRQKAPQFSDEFDRYWQLNQTIKKTSDALNELAKSQEYAFGNEKIKNIEKQNALLQIQLKNIKALNKAQKKERKELQNQAKKRKYGAKFDKDGYLSNYNTITHKELKRYTKALKSGNEKTMDAAKERYEAFKKWLSRYEKLTQDELVNSKEQMKELMRQMVEGNIEKIETKIQLDIDTRDAKRTWDKFLKDTSRALSDTFSAFKDFSFFGDNLDNDIQTIKDRAKDVKAYTERANRYDEISKTKKAWDEYVKKTPEKDRIASSRSEAQKLAQENRQKAIDAGNDAMSALDDGINQFVGAIQEFGSQIDFVNNQFKEQQDIINYNKELIELTYGDKAYDLMEDYYGAEVSFLESKKSALETQRDTYEEIWKADKEVQEAAGKTWDPNKPETWSKAGVEAYNKMTEAASELRDVNLEMVKILKEDYLNTLNKILDDHEKLLTGGVSLDEASEQWERAKEEAEHYLDTVERTYQVQTLMNKFDQSIQETKSTKAAKQLTELRAKELKYLSEKKKLTKYDLDAANARYNIALKEIALQEAQNNKNTMKLTRNEQGNWTYQYVANQDDVKSKEQDLMDATNEYYDLAKSHYKESVSDMISLQQQYVQSMREIADLRFTNEEEYNRRKAALDEWYYNKSKRLAEENSLYQQDMIIAGTGVLKEQYDIDRASFETLNLDKLGFIQSLKTQGITEFSELFGKFGGYSETAGTRMVTALLTGNDAAFPQIDKGLAELVKSAGTYIINGNEKSQSLTGLFNSAGQQICNSWLNEDGYMSKLEEGYKKLEEKAQTISEKIVSITGGKEGIKGAFDKAKNSASKLNKQMSTLCGYAKSQLPNLIGKVKDLASAYDKVVKAANSAKSAVDKANKQVKDVKVPNVAKDTAPVYYTTPSSGSGSGSGSGSSNSGKVTDKIKTKTPKYKITYSNRVLAKGFKSQSKAQDKLDKKKSYYNNLYNNWAHNIPGSKPLSKEQAEERTAWNNAKIVQYRTGGYTGTWNDSGRLAVLHQKELVLNKEDTRNMLDTVNAIRDIKDLNSSISKTISDSLGNLVLNAMQTMKSGTIGNTEKDKSENIVIENINAEFPNAENVNEIREAIMSLPQLASQYVSRNLK